MLRSPAPMQARTPSSLTACSSAGTLARKLAWLTPPGTKFLAQVAHLFRAPNRRLPMEPLEEARVIANKGLVGCAHARSGGRRQVLLVDRETLEAMDLRPG